MKRSRCLSLPRLVLGGLFLTVLVPLATAYVNGGDFHDSRKAFQKKLRDEGWSVRLADPMPKECDVNQLLGQALQDLPRAKVEEIPVEVKRQIARMAKEAIQATAATGKELITRGEKVGIQYQVGTCKFETYWETNYGGRREIHARRSGFAPFVALKVASSTD